VASFIWTVDDLCNLIVALHTATNRLDTGEFAEGYNAALSDLCRALGLSTLHLHREQRPRVRVIESQRMRR